MYFRPGSFFAPAMMRLGKNLLRRKKEVKISKCSELPKPEEKNPPTCPPQLTRDTDNMAPLDLTVRAVQTIPNDSHGEDIPEGELTRDESASGISGLAKIEMEKSTSNEIPQQQTSESPTLSPTQVVTKPYKCHLCHQSFTKLIKLYMHNRIHDGQPLHQCPICFKWFTRRQTLKLHIMQGHPDDRPHQCHLCSKSYKQKQHLKDHILTHSQLRPHRCQICEQSFLRQWNLKRHIQTQHSQEVPTSSKASSEPNPPNKLLPPSHSKLPIQSPKKALPYQCEWCPKSFPRKRSLTLHIQNHLSTRPHRCELCSKAFKRGEHLTVHMRTHTRETPYQCGVCHRSWAQLSSLTLHIKTHHKGEQPLSKSF